jgi:multiple sugar transport system substrate-binding protein
MSNLTNLKKQILPILALAVLTVTAMFSCSKAKPAGSGTTQIPAASSAEKSLSGEITFSTWGSADEKAVNEEIIKVFEGKYPGTKVNLEYIPSDYLAKIDTMFVGGDAPDVLYGHPHYFTGWAKQGLIKNLSSEFAQDKAFYDDPKFAQNMYSSFQYRGIPVATINGHDTFLLYYNKNLFDEAGVAYPDDNWTWDDWLTAAKRLTNNEEGENKRYAMKTGNILVYVYSFGGDVFDSMDNPTRVVFNSPETVEALKFVQDAIWVHKVVPEYGTSDSFDTGRVAMDIDGSWSPSGRRHITDFKWDMANIPVYRDKPRRTAAYFAGYAVNNASRNPDLAYAFAKFFQEDEGQTILSKLGLITVINQDIASLPENLNGPGFPEHHGLRVSSISYATNGYANLSNWQEMLDMVLYPNFEALTLNTQSPQDTAVAIQTGLEKLLVESR